MVRSLNFFIFLISITIFSSCSSYDKVLKSSNLEDKYRMANELYESGDFVRSNKLFEQVQSAYRGKPQAERITFLLAESNYAMGDYLLASYYYGRFVKSYPESSKLDEASYKKAYCYYLDSPRYSLDQENTTKAIAEMQKYVNRFPNSSNFDRANEIIRELSLKLEKKDYFIAMQYMKLEHYKSADIAFGNFISQYPDSKYREEVFYQKFISLYLYASNSFLVKQKERYIDAKTAFLLLKKRYPNSHYIEKAAKYYQKTLDALKNLEVDMAGM